MSPTKTELVHKTGAVKTPRKKKVPGLSAALAGIGPVSYTHLTLPTKLEV